MEENDFNSIYYGINKVYYKKVNGNVYNYNENDWLQEISLNSLNKIINRLKPIEINNINELLIIPGIPSFDYQLKENINLISININQFIHSNNENNNENNEKIPLELSIPLIKCSKNESNYELIGIASGIRSSLIQINNKWYRLKGCGNNNDGFSIRKRIHPVTSLVNHINSSNNELPKDWCDIRGCAFMNTAIRELYYTKKLTNLLPSIISTNKSIGFTLYNEPELLPFGDIAQTVCIIEETIGDRRLGTHVLAGLHLLLPYLIPDSLVNNNGLLNLFPLLRPGRETNELSNIITTGEFITDYALGTSSIGNDINIKGLCWSDLSRDDSTMVNLTLQSTCIPIQLSSEYPSQWTNNGPIEMTPHWKSVWDLTINKLHNLLKNLHEKNNQEILNNQTLLSESINPNENLTYITMVLNYLYSRFGYDCGYILSSMHSHRISWGTYQDAMCRIDWDEWHCNAHINNLVIIPPSQSYEQSQSQSQLYEQSKEFFLSYLDLDMAYNEDEVINVENKKYGKDSEYPFNNVLWREYVNMMEVLAGNDSSTGVPQIALSVITSYSNTLKGIQSCLNDTMILSYIESYQQNLKNQNESKKFTLEYNKELHDASYCLIELAIIIMVYYIA